MNYFLGIAGNGGYRPECASPTLNPNHVSMFDCQSRIRLSMCQLPLRSRQLHFHLGSTSSAIMAHEQQKKTSSLSTKQQKQPSIARVKTLNVTATGQWRPVTCDRGHLMHVFLACDTSAACWAGGDVTFSRHSDTWATPTSESCPISLVVPPLPPSFLCRSGEQHVPYSLVCDHRRDCLDGGDEVFCHFLPCLDHSQFQCHSKQVGHVSLCSLRWHITPSQSRITPTTPNIYPKVPGVWRSA